MEAKDLNASQRVFLCTNVHGEPTRYVAQVLGEGGSPAPVIFWLREDIYRALGVRTGWARIWLRIQMYVLYPLKLVWSLARARKGHIFVVTTNCFYAPLLASILGRARGCPVVHLLFDLFPDGIEVAGKLHVNGFISRMIGWIPRATQRWSSGVVYLGEYLRWHAEQRWGKNSHATCIDVGTDHTRFSAGVRSSNDGVVRVRYGGQLGHFHDAGTLAECIAHVLKTRQNFSPRIAFSFFVSGVGTFELKRRLQGLPVQIDLPIEDDNWRETLSSFQVGLLSTSPRGASVCLPNKLYGMLAAGQAILALCPIWGDLARIIVKHKVGWVVNNSAHFALRPEKSVRYLRRLGDVRTLSDVIADFERAIDEILSNADEVERRRENARKVAWQYGLENTRRHWQEFLQPLRTSRC